MRKLDKTEILVTIGVMAYVREVTKLTCIVFFCIVLLFYVHGKHQRSCRDGFTCIDTCIDVCVYISSLTQCAYFLSLFELVSLLSKQSNAFKAALSLLLRLFA